MPDVNRLPEGTHIQEIIMPKSDWTKAESKAWLVAESYHVDGLEVTDESYRWTQVDIDESAFDYHTDEQLTSDGKPIKFTYGAAKAEVRTVMFRGYVRATVGYLSKIAVRAESGKVSQLVDVALTHLGNSGASAGDPVLVRCEFAGEELLTSEAIARCIVGAQVDTYSEYMAKVAGTSPQQQHEVRSAPIISHREAVTDDDKPNRQLVTVVVYEPGRMDIGYGTTASPETVEAWCHSFMISNIALRGETVTDRHWLRDADGSWVLRDASLGDVWENGIAINRISAPPADVYVVESWIKRCDCPVNGKEIAKGSWMAEVWIKDLEIWAQVLDGTYNGVSVELWKKEA